MTGPTPDPTPMDGGDDTPGIEHVDGRLRPIAKGVRRIDRDADLVAARLTELADGYRDNPGAMVQAADDDGSLAAEIAACYQYVEVARGRFARYLEDTADRLAESAGEGEQ